MLELFETALQEYAETLKKTNARIKFEILDGVYNPEADKRIVGGEKYFIKLLINGKLAFLTELYIKDYKKKEDAIAACEKMFVKLVLMKGVDGALISHLKAIMARDQINPTKN